MEKIDLLKEIWDAVYCPKNDVATTIEKYFHPNYIQSINGVLLNRIEYIQHVIEQKKNMTVEIIDYQQALEKDNELFAIYFPKGKNKNNQPIEAEVIAYFLFQDQQILRIQGAVRLIEGNYADVDMSSKKQND